MSAVLLFALFGTACASSDSNGETDGSSSTTAVEDEDTSMAASSPLSAFFIDNGGLQATMMSYIVLVEEEIQLCMAADGFEYIAQNRSVPASVSEALTLTQREWATEFGYGIATEVSSFDPRDSEDPNSALILQMSGSERELWVGALMGGAPDAEPGSIDQRPLADQGCVGQAFINTGGQYAFEGMQTLETSVEDLETTLVEQRDVVEAIDKWSRCLSELGYPNFGRLDEPEEYSRDQLEEFAESVYASLPDITDEERAAWFRGEWTGEEPDFGATGLPKLQQEEIALALHDLDCYEAHVKAVYEPLRDELEYGLIDNQGDLLSALRDLGS